MVWSLKDEYKSVFEQDPTPDLKFKIKAWMPQVEVLNHRSVRACLTHCGWGGIMECIGAAVPMVTFPHFGDQSINSDLIVESKIGVELHSEDRTLETKDPLTYRQPVFDDKKVVDVFNKVLKDPQYKANVTKLQAIDRMQNGRE